MTPAKAKEKHPEWYCPEPKCLWRVLQANVLFPYLDDTPCPKHMTQGAVSAEIASS